MTDDQHIFSSIESWLKAQVPSKSPQARACVELAERLNRADHSLSVLLANDCEHESQTRWEPICGGANVARFFLAQFACAPRLAFAELAVQPMGEEPCVLMHVRDSGFGRLGLGVARSSITLKLDQDGLIRRTFSTSLAAPAALGRASGLYPGMTGADLERERQAIGQPLPVDESLELFLFHLPELVQDAREYLSTVDHVASSLGLPQARLHALEPGNDFGPHLGAISHPTVVLACGGRRVRLVEGFASADELRLLLGGALERSGN